MACRSVPFARHHHRGVAQSRRYLGGPEDPDVGGGQFDRQRQSLESSTDLLDRGAIVLGDAEIGLCGRGAFLEQLHRLAQASRRSQGQRTDGEQLFALDAEYLAAGREDLHGRGHRQQSADHLGARVDEMLTVVEHQEELLRSQVLGQRAECVGGLARDTEEPAQGLGQQASLPEIREFDGPDAVGKLASHAGGDGEGQTGLPDSADAGQRQQSCGSEQGSCSGQIVTPADEARQFHREVAARTRSHRPSISPCLREKSASIGPVGDGHRSPSSARRTALSAAAFRCRQVSRSA